MQKIPVPERILEGSSFIMPRAEGNKNVCVKMSKMVSGRKEKNKCRKIEDARSMTRISSADGECHKMHGTPSVMQKERKPCKARRLWVYNGPVERPMQSRMRSNDAPFIEIGLLYGHGNRVPTTTTEPEDQSFQV